MIKNVRIHMEVQPHIIPSGAAGIHLSIGRATPRSPLRIAIATKRIRFLKVLCDRVRLNQQLFEASLDTSQAKSHSATTRTPFSLKGA